MTTAKKRNKRVLGGGGGDNLRVKYSSGGKKNKLLKAELAFLSIMALAGEAYTQLKDEI